ncbi:MAG: tetratricopeptide repeat protein [Deinococcus-Thermus bacterium]|jgi:predicted negative regulator of RcsB-dependent stress response|nr:tetratricopeptide repeat protein [Deinococcota bacterium]
MAELTTDDEKAEAIKKWWKENGTAVVVGIVVGLALVFGWRAWSQHRTQVAQRASLGFEQLLMSAASGRTEAARKQAEALTEDYGGTPYAALADLALASVLVEDEQLEPAEKALRSAIERAPDPSLARLAAYRLARVLIAREALEEAEQMIDAHDDGTAFAADFAGLRGDIAAARGDLAAARDAYRQAIDGGAGMARLIELKLQDLPPGGAS